MLFCYALMATFKWWEASVDPLGPVTPGASVARDAAANICRRVQGAMIEIGLSALDGALVAEAIGVSDLIPERLADLIAAESSCRAV